MSVDGARQPDPAMQKVSLDDAASGEDVVISRGDGADIRLVPVIAPEPRPGQGESLNGKLHFTDDSDNPIPGFKPTT